MAGKLVGIYGASGFGREVMPVAREMFASDDCELVFIDDNPELVKVNGVRVLTYSDFLKHEAEEKRVSVAIADAKTRREIEERCYSDGIKPASVNSPNNVVLDEVQIGSASILCPFVTLTSNITIGQSFHANIYSYVAHDCVIGDYVTFAPAVKCNGNVVIEDNAYIGTGAIIKQGQPGSPIVIGEGATVGMGAVVTKNVAPGSVVIGNPAKPLVRNS
ncbi:acetyltransferase [Marinobacter oulmenensis]|uniref:Sugar O-acyltransferase (Sialic acid O-acetyltransferase NeuD family) n=1 Tax=Marinobacter oulmenensis TaxID=643747 RepID=A0A840UJP8_9GAMM|nr:acetyltransferase [Marinobacter oulmenensis]MBB5322525.1 sugar O-acyltransferase (sialic acid O-acetyltransferase NeuD family) [Marinobacter oulmenensis]